MEAIFSAMSKASEMNPDPMSDEDLDGGDAFVAPDDLDFPITYEGCGDDDDGEGDENDGKTKESNGGLKRKL